MKYLKIFQVIFFILFTYAEEAGILPRIAFNFDKICKCSGCHGKQSLTMCSGFGCNACAVVGSRIIDSKRDKIIAILTNSFIPSKIFSKSFKSQLPSSSALNVLNVALDSSQACCHGTKLA